MWLQNKVVISTTLFSQLFPTRKFSRLHRKKIGCHKNTILDKSKGKGEKKLQIEEKEAREKSVSIARLWALITIRIFAGKIFPPFLLSSPSGLRNWKVKLVRSSPSYPPPPPPYTHMHILFNRKREEEPHLWLHKSTSSHQPACNKRHSHILIGQICAWPSNARKKPCRLKIQTK